MAQQPKKGYVRGEMGGLYKKKDLAAWEAGAAKDLAKAKAPVSAKEKIAMQKAQPKIQAKLQAEFKRLNALKKK